MFRNVHSGQWSLSWPLWSGGAGLWTSMFFLGRPGPALSHIKSKQCQKQSHYVKHFRFILKPIHHIISWADMCAQCKCKPSHNSPLKNLHRFVLPHILQNPFVLLHSCFRWKWIQWIFKCTDTVDLNVFLQISTSKSNFLVSDSKITSS